MVRRSSGFDTLFLVLSKQRTNNVTRSNVWYFTQCQLFLTPLPSHSPNHDQTRMYPKPYRQGHLFLSLQTGIQVSHRSEDTQARPYCSLGIIFMGLGIAKIDE
jgi:hypothetical protein